jgi:hypothetical protein
MVGDDWSKRLPGTYPWIAPASVPTTPLPNNILQLVPRYEFDALKREVEQMKKELEAAKAQDVADGNPDCEMEEKVELLKKIAELVGVDLSTVFDK